jgi:hypothetical protein
MNLVYNTPDGHWGCYWKFREVERGIRGKRDSDKHRDKREKHNNTSETRMRQINSKNRLHRNVSTFIYTYMLCQNGT